VRPCWTVIRGLAGIVLVVSTVAFAESGGSATAKPQSTAKKSTTKSSKPSTKHTSHKGKKSRTSWRRGQQKVDPARSREIQQALIREHYLNGAPSGKWDAATEDAMRRFQADNGWQNKTVPDSRALIKLGLGPNHDHLLNPESAMTTAPAATATTTAPAQTPSHSMDPAGSTPQPRP
jgi:peptidoglycan hydrolase-like protein with peptidoglycan-binding domain